MLRSSSHPLVRVALPAVLAAFLSFGCSTDMAPGDGGWRSQPSRPRAERDVERSTDPGAKHVRRGDWLSYPGDEELWILERGTEVARAQEPEGPGTGALLAERGSAGRVPIPLERTDVRARISGFVATVDVMQRFVNPFAEKIEAVYVFPLPHNAAVRDFAMRIGERKIRGIIREREEARAIYEEARANGYRAALLTQERPNVFAQHVANIEPGRAIEIELQYLHTLGFEEDAFTFVFPMVVGPRYNPPGTRDGIGATAYGRPGSSSQRTEVAYLPPGQRSGSDLSIAVEIEAGLPIEALRSPSHDIHVELDETRAVAHLAPAAEIANRDFVLSYRVGGEEIQPALLLDRGEGESNHLSLLLVPPKYPRRAQREPLEMIFVVDASGSMKGRPLEQARETVRLALEDLAPEDAFQIVRFSDEATTLASGLLPATAENRRRALRYLDDLESEGGTQMTKGVVAALDLAHEEERTRYVAFLTDGYIGNESEVLRVLHEHLGSARVFAFGVGTSVNRHLLEAMARFGQGAVAFLGAEVEPREAVRGFLERVTHPALSHVSIDWGRLEVEDVQPARIPDLYIGRPVVVSTRFRGAPHGTVRVRGFMNGRRHEIALDLDALERTDHPGIACVWARRKLMSLEDRAIAYPDGSASDEILSLALAHGLLSERTSYLAVDASQRTKGASGVTVQVPVEMPAGVRYDTTVRDGE